MDAATLLAHCLALPGAWPDNPWDHELPVIKVGPAGRGKIFAFLGAEKVGLKCGRSREEADTWLGRAVVAGLPKKFRPEGWDAI